MSADQDAKGVWRVNTTSLLNEVLCNRGAAVLRVPILILLRLLMAVAKRATEINDPELNRLMMRLALYQEGDPYAEDYDPDLYRRIVGDDGGPPTSAIEPAAKRPEGLADSAMMAEAADIARRYGGGAIPYHAALAALISSEDKIKPVIINVGSEQVAARIMDLKREIDDLKAKAAE